MTNNPHKPRDYDAVLGGQAPAPKTGAVLGGIEGVKIRLASPSIKAQVAALSEVVNYGKADWEWTLTTFQDDLERVEEAAYSLFLNRIDIKSQQSLLVVQYLQLHHLLSGQKWKEADEKTSAILLDLSGRTRQGFMRIEDLEKFPCQYLCNIDRLWVKYSQGKFGFTVQKPIWQSVGGTPKPEWNVWCRFGERIGWYRRDSWLWWNDLTFDLKAPAGHLPRGGAFIGWGLGDFWTGCRVFSCLFSKLTDCDL